MDRYRVRLVLDDQACARGQTTLEVREPYPDSLRVRDILAPGLETMVSEHVPDGNALETVRHVITAAT
jgi:hypothetical protein